MRTKVLRSLHGCVRFVWINHCFALNRSMQIGGLDCIAELISLTQDTSQKSKNSRGEIKRSLQNENKSTYCLLPFKYFMISSPHSTRLPAPYPGRSITTNPPSFPADTTHFFPSSATCTPPTAYALNARVRPRFLLVYANSSFPLALLLVAPRRALRREDLPTLERPRNATSLRVEWGRCMNCGTEMRGRGDALLRLKNLVMYARWAPVRFEGRAVPVRSGAGTVVVGFGAAEVVIRRQRGRMQTGEII